MPDQFIHIANITDIEPSGMYRADINGRSYLIAYINGEYYCTDDMCTHEDSSLYLGVLKDGCVECTLHSSRFDLKTGKPMNEPATEPLNTYTVKIEDGKILILPVAK